jgi:hypothetical protein
MPFGKYKGDRLSELPLGYLAWLIENVQLYGGLDADVRAEIARRVAPDGGGGDYEAGYRDGFRDGRRKGRGRGSWREAVNRWFRRLALEHHPDRGGGEGVMAALNDAKGRLEEVLADLEEGES